MTNVTHIVLKSYTPPRVKRLINPSGGSCNIGEIDDTTVLKYPRMRKDMKRVQIEAKMLAVLGPHPRIAQSKGLTDDGLLLEFMPNGNVYDYLSTHPDVSLDRRLAWCVQAAEAVTCIHSRRVVHCDIRHDNLLLDANLDLKLADFQGQHFSPTGAIVLDGGSCESAKAWLPRHPPDRCNIRTDLFALGSALQFLITGAEVFPDLVRSSETDEDIMRWFYETEPEIERRFRAGEFPPPTSTYVLLSRRDVGASSTRRQTRWWPTSRLSRPPLHVVNVPRLVFPRQTSVISAVAIGGSTGSARRMRSGRCRQAAI